MSILGYGGAEPDRSGGYGATLDSHQRKPVATGTWDGDATPHPSPYFPDSTLSADCHMSFHFVPGAAPGYAHPGPHGLMAGYRLPHVWDPYSLPPFRHGPAPLHSGVQWQPSQFCT